MSKIHFVAAALVAMTLTACNDYSTPQGVLGSAFQAIKKGDVKNLRRHLGGDAYQNYGNGEGIARMRRRMEGATDLTFGKVHVLNAVKWPGGMGAGYTDYQVEIMRKTVEIPLFVTFMRAGVRCSYSLVNDPVFNYEGGDNNYDTSIMHSYCQIHDLD